MTERVEGNAGRRCSPGTAVPGAPGTDSALRRGARRTPLVIIPWTLHVMDFGGRGCSSGGTGPFIR